jgi:hypothetical protein
LVFRSNFISHTHILALGNVRKQLGLSFHGETRDVDWLLYGDVELEGLDKDVSLLQNTRNPHTDWIAECTSQHWHTWGDMGAKT